MDPVGYVRAYIESAKGLTAAQKKSQLQDVTKYIRRYGAPGV